MLIQFRKSIDLPKLASRTFENKGSSLCVFLKAALFCIKDVCLGVNLIMFVEALLHRVLPKTCGPLPVILLS